MWKRAAIVVGILVVLAAGAALYVIGPRNVIGILRYDQRREGALKVGDRAPDVLLSKLDGEGEQHLSALLHDRPLVLVFGSFT